LSMESIESHLTRPDPGINSSGLFSMEEKRNESLIQDLKEVQSSIFPKTPYTDFELTVAEIDRKVTLHVSRFFLDDMPSLVVKQWVVDGGNLTVSDYSASSYETIFRYYLHDKTRNVTQIDNYLEVLPLAHKLHFQDITEKCLIQFKNDAVELETLESLGYGRYVDTILNVDWSEQPLQEIAMKHLTRWSEKRQSTLILKLVAQIFISKKKK